MANPVLVDDFKDAFVPVPLWGKDHWSTLGYMATVLVDYAGFEVGFDPKMRQNRRNFRVMMEQCPKPKGRKDASKNTMFGMGEVMQEVYSTRLSNKTLARGHDDWNCVQDMAKARLLTCKPEGVEPGKTLQFSPKGWRFSSPCGSTKLLAGPTETSTRSRPVWSRSNWTRRCLDGNPSSGRIEFVVQIVVAGAALAPLHRVSILGRVLRTRG